MEGYWDLSVVIDGAEDEAVTRESDAAKDAYLAEIRAFAGGYAGTVEVFALWHEHADDGRECSCVQYVTDHGPLWSSEVSL